VSRVRTRHRMSPEAGAHREGLPQRLHTPAEIGLDDARGRFEAERSPDGKYRTTPLAGRLFTRTRDFFHDGRFATLTDVVNHFDSFQKLGLTDTEKNEATARFITSQPLANQLGHATTSAERQQLLRPLLACDVADPGRAWLSAETAGLWTPERVDRWPVRKTSNSDHVNKSLTEWAAIVQDASLAALVDRILHHGEPFTSRDLHGDSKAVHRTASW
jgi:hypothetical protein